MFFAKKAKGFCVEIGEYSTLVARLSQFQAPIVVEELKHLASPDEITAWTKSTEGRGATGYAHSTVGVYPAKRLLRRHTLDLKRAKDPAYFAEVCTQQFRVEPDKYTCKVLNRDDGSEYDQTKGAQKEALFCAVANDEVVAFQDKLLAQGVYPERLELGSLATLGGLVSYLKFKQSKTPVLLLEIGQETTHSFILSADGVDISRPIGSGIAAMIPIVQKELGLKDEESAKKLFYSNTFDFTSMGGVLVKKLLKDLQSSIGFYEVQTGQSVGSVLCTQLPVSLNWLGSTVAAAIGLPQLKIELLPWIESQNIKLAEGVTLSQPEEHWFGLFSLLASYDHVVPDEKK